MNNLCLCLNMLKLIVPMDFVLFHSIEKGSLSVINNNENNHTEDREFS